MTPERQRASSYLESIRRPFFFGTDAIPSRRSTNRRRYRHSTSEFRASVYRHNLWVNPLPDVTGRYRECSPEFYRLNPAQVHRLVPWLNRELNVLQVPHHRTLILVEDIITMISQFSITSVEFQAYMTSQVGIHAQHFIHEFYAFARSPYDMIGFDETAEYHSRPSYSIEVQAIESDSDSDIVILSPEPQTPSLFSRDQPHSSQVQPLNLSASSSRVQPVLSPEPGPSGVRNPEDLIQMIAHELQHPTYPSYTDRNRPIRIDTPPESSNNSHTLVDSDTEDCVVVGYVKPRHERTPEIITLTSDAEIEREETVPNERDSVEESRSILDFLSTSSSPTTNDSSDSDFIPQSLGRRKATVRRRKIEICESDNSSSSPVRKVYDSTSDSSSLCSSRKHKKCKSKSKHKKGKSSRPRSSSHEPVENSRPEKVLASKNRKSRQEVWRIVRKQEPETDHDYSRDCYDPPYTEDERASLSSDYRPKLRSIVITKSARNSGQREHSYSSVASSSRSSSHYHEGRRHRHKSHKRDTKKRKERKRSESSSPVRSKGKKVKNKRSRRIVDSSS